MSKSVAELEAELAAAREKQAEADKVLAAKAAEADRVAQQIASKHAELTDRAEHVEALQRRVAEAQAAHAECEGQLRALEQQFGQLKG
jgi:chromosome segregation ATPase